MLLTTSNIAIGHLIRLMPDAIIKCLYHHKQEQHTEMFVHKCHGLLHYKNMICALHTNLLHVNTINQ